LTYASPGNSFIKSKEGDFFKNHRDTRRCGMYDKDELCKKIKDIYPDIGECGIDVKVDYDDDKKAWIVDLKKDNHELKTHLEPEDAETCMLGKQCIGLGIQIAQLKDNIMKT
jgi:hypothetical protein